LKCPEEDLAAAFAALGLAAPGATGEKPAFVEVGERLWWLNRDQRGGVWINERDKGEAGGQEQGAGGAEQRQEAQPDAAMADAAPPAGSPLTALRLLMKRTKTGAHSGETARLAATIGKSPEELLAALAGAGLQVPDRPRAKPVFVEHAGEIFWLNRNSKDEIWLNAKASKFQDREPDAEGDAPAEPADAGAAKAEAGPSA
jgi:hypothetical protein